MKDTGEQMTKPVTIDAEEGMKSEEGILQLLWDKMPGVDHKTTLCVRYIDTEGLRIATGKINVCLVCFGKQDISDSNQALLMLWLT